MEGSTKIVNFMTPGTGGFVLRVWLYKPYREYVLSSTRSIYSTSINISLEDLLPLLIFLYSMMELLICKYEPFCQDLDVESLILR